MKQEGRRKRRREKAFQTHRPIRQHTSKTANSKIRRQQRTQAQDRSHECKCLIMADFLQPFELIDGRKQEKGTLSTNSDPKMVCFQQERSS
jgi:hypothetical protein